MSHSRVSQGLRELLGRPNPHEFLPDADRLRRERHGKTATYAAIGHLDLDSGRTWCPVTGIEAPPGGFARSLEQLDERLSDLILLVGTEPTIEDLRRAWGAVPPRPTAEEERPEGLLATVQLGCSSDWMHAIEGAGASDETVLGDFVARGLHVLSDGIRPRFHPRFGLESGRRWEHFWRSAASAGLRGHAVVLYGPELDLDQVFLQIETIAGVQDDTEVFLSVAPVVHLSGGLGGSADALLTQAMLDLKVLAVCRLGLPQVPHVRFCTERSDLKSAHVALSCGADDLEGALFLGERSRKDDAEAEDLSLSEIVAWLVEAGFEPRLRNALFESVPTDRAG